MPVSAPAVAPPAAALVSDTAASGRTERRRATRTLAAGATVAVCGLLAWHLLVKVGYQPGRLTMIYSLVVGTYVVSRFVLAACYRPPKNAGLEPTVAVIVPAFNAGEAVVRSIDAILALDYPQAKLEVVCVNDGSTDDTYELMVAAAARYPQGAVRCIDLGSNQGKRAAMAAGIRATSAEILVFVDSDSLPAPGAVRLLVQGFADPRNGAMAGLTYVRNDRANMLTKMQAARYYVSYQLLKSAESVFGAVACCSGCFSAYRRDAILPLLDDWEHQTWFGIECTYGDDRSLTNYVLRAGWRARYDSRAEAWTDAPDRYRKFFKQQLRWKKSWVREGPLLLGHLWRTRPAAFPSALAATMTGLLSPVVVLSHVLYAPLHGVTPLIYGLGLYLVAMGYGLFYRALKADSLWLYAVVGTLFYVSFSPQLLWAVARIKDGSWGTRSA